MGWLRSELGRISTLGARTTAGRAPTAGLAIPDHRASSYHATFDWGAAGWTVKDLGSRNGTWVDGRRLEPGASASLGVGSVIALGAPDLAWTMVDAGPPVPRAWR